jgi:hypothetical protein
MESQGCNTPPTAHLPRFVILKHVRQQDTHWDLMLELPGQELLATWQVHLPPEQWGPVVPAVRLPDHRRLYLEYEGEISGNRGHVTWVDEGTAEVLQTGQRWQIRLEGRKVKGKFEVQVL